MSSFHLSGFLLKIRERTTSYVKTPTYLLAPPHSSNITESNVQRNRHSVRTEHVRHAHGRLGTVQNLSTASPRVPSSFFRTYVGSLPDRCSGTGISPTWHITSKGMFAGSCIGIICLVLLLELLRRLQREFECWIQPQQHSSSTNDNTNSSNPSKVDSNCITNRNDDVDTERQPPSTLSLLRKCEQPIPLGVTRYVPTLVQQVVRAAIHTMQFALAYIIMLLAMYYNGYVIVCIFLGVFVGFMVFSWDACGVTSM